LPFGFYSAYWHLSYSFFPVAQPIAIIKNLLGGSGLPLLQGSRRVEKNLKKKTLRFVKNVPK